MITNLGRRDPTPEDLISDSHTCIRCGRCYSPIDRASLALHHSCIEWLMKNVEWQLRVKGEVAVTPQDVIRATARYFRIQVEVIREKDAHKFVNRARQIAVWICHEKFPEMSYPDLGVVFNRDHTTIMSSVRKMGAEIEFKKDEKLKVQIAAIVEMVW